MARKRISDIPTPQPPKSSVDYRPAGGNLRVKPNFKVDPSKTSLTAPGGSGNAKEPDRSREIIMGNETRNRTYAPGGSGGTSEGQFVNGQYTEQIKDRGKNPVPNSYVQRKRGEAATTGSTVGRTPGQFRPRASGSGTGANVAQDPRSATSGAVPQSRNGGTGEDPKRDQPKDDKAPQQPSGGSASAGSSSSSSSSSSTGSTPQRQTRPGASGEKKMVPAPPGSLNFYMKKAAQSGDKNVQQRAYQMWKNSKKSPGKSLSAGMNVAQKDLPANPKKGDAVKGRGGVTWTWNGTRWSRGKAD